MAPQRGPLRWNSADLLMLSPKWREVEHYCYFVLMTGFSPAFTRLLFSLWRFVEAIEKDKTIRIYHAF